MTVKTSWTHQGVKASILALSVALAACGGSGGGSGEANPADTNPSDSTPVETPRSTELDLSYVAVQDNDTGLPEAWFRKGVFIEIFVRSYFDSNGDGYGDFDGLTQKLDYLEALGIKGIWLMPTMSSQDRDHGYAVTDYRGVEQDYGDTDSFRNFLQQAHARGIGVIIDYVMNHSAAQNPLFIDSIYSLEDKRGWYMWRDNYVNWPQPWGTGDTWHLRNGAYYYGIFWDQMPDFNLENPEVMDFHANAQRYWLNMGVDGFRFDAVSHLVESDSGQLEGHPKTFEILSDVQENIKQYENRYMVCESPGYAMQMSGDDVCGSAFGFGLNYALVRTARTGTIASDLDAYLNHENIHNTALVLANHDRFAGSRLIEQFGGDEQRYKMAVASLMTLPGIPFIYYGEEIGMGHNGQGNDLDLRAPMSWTSDSKTAGFTEGTPYRALANNRSNYNVEDQLNDPDSLLNFYKQMIALRNAESALQTGAYSRLNNDSDSVLSFFRGSGDNKTLVLLNYGTEARDIDIVVSPTTDWQMLYPHSASSIESDTSGAMRVQLSGLSMQVYRLN